MGRTKLGLKERATVSTAGPGPARAGTPREMAAGRVPRAAGDDGGHLVSSGCCCPGQAVLEGAAAALCPLDGLQGSHGEPGRGSGAGGVPAEPGRAMGPPGAGVGVSGELLPHLSS